ncbi:MAG: response regulator [Salinivirgaceae bacterium]|nr:response regulator [Salinivirgaceae bacterium]
MDSNSKAKILLVDDNPSNLQVLGTLLKKLNFQVEFALDGLEALNWVKKEIFDMILLDVEMPNLNGYEVCLELKKNPETKEIPVIFVTVRDDIESTVKGFEVGAVDFISKPFNLNELRARISTQIELKRASDILKKYSVELERKNNIIMESMNYAQHIQNHILPEKELIKKNFAESFIIYRPKQIISGDFFWFKSIGNYKIFSVIDCTGHGVPGAIMSMIGFTAINDAINDNNILEPASILNHIHSFFVKTLHKESSGGIEDGMEITMCVLNTETNKLQFASTNQKMFAYTNNDLQQYAGDHWSIGEYQFAFGGYTQKTIDFNKNDCVYLFSDGFFDQFGAEKNKKYSLKRFREKVDSIKELPMSEQYKILINELENWQGEKDQIDDITVWGIRY